MKEAQDKQKSYADLYRRLVEFEIGEHVFHKILPIKGVMRFDKSEKLSPRCVGHFKILKRVGEVAYQLALPPILTSTYDVFYVSMLKKYILDRSHKIDYKDLKIQDYSRHQGEGAKDKNHSNGEGSLEESRYRRSHLGGRSGHEDQVFRIFSLDKFWDNFFKGCRM